MSNNKNSVTGVDNEDRGSEADKSVARLMNIAGLRPEIPAEIEDRVYRHVKQEWHTNQPVSRTRQWAVPLALAASILIAVSFIIRPTLSDAPMVGTIARIGGGASTTTRGLATGDIVRVGDSLQTGDRDSLSIELSNGTSLRLATNTSLQMTEQRVFTLLSGKLYADSGQTEVDGNNLVVHTDYGVVTDVGTQFLVSVVDGSLAVAVRLGRVDVWADRETYAAAAGSSLMVRSSGRVTTGEIDATDNVWDWTLALASEFEIENRSLLDFLTWVARETGMELIFLNDVVRAAAASTVLHGSIAGLTPVEAAETILATTSVAYALGESSIIIGR